jgi:hypothetical protein
MKIFIFTQDDGLMSIGTPCYQEGMTEQEKNLFPLLSLQIS